MLCEIQKDLLRCVQHKNISHKRLMCLNTLILVTFIIFLNLYSLVAGMNPVISDLASVIHGSLLV